MNIKILLLNILILVKISKCYKINKCCSNNKVLTISPNNTNINCIEKKFVYKFKSYDNNLEIINNKSSNIPICGKYSYLKITNITNFDIDLEQNSCIDLSEFNEVIFIFCDQSSASEIVGRRSLPLIPIAKCFDSGGNNFIEKLIDSLKRKEDIDTSLSIIRYGQPYCHMDQSFIELRFEEFIVLSGFKLMLKNNGDNESLEIDLSNYTEYCVDSVNENKKILIKICQSRNYCDKIQCIQKCCRSWKVLDEKTLKCDFDNRLNVEPKFYDVKIKNETQNQGFGLISLIGYVPEFKQPLNNGYINSKNGKLHHELTVIDQDDYCVELISNGTDYKMGFFATNAEVNLKTTQKKRIQLSKSWKFLETAFPYLYRGGLVISCVFAFTTLIIYLMVPELFNIHGQIVCGYVGSLIFTYSALFFADFKTPTPDFFCQCIGYQLVFGFLSKFAWLNNLGFDIYNTTRSVHRKLITSKRDERRKFSIYLCYAFCVPFSLTAFIYVLERTTLLELESRPLFGHRSCFFYQVNISFTCFFILPIAIKFSINIIFFVATTVYALRVRSRINKFNNSNNSSQNRNKFYLTAKLFVIMGISWMFMIFIFFFPMIVLIFVLLLFSLQGFLIFIVFICKKSTYKKMHSCFFERKNPVGINIETSGSTSTSRNSRTQILGSSVRTVFA